MARYASTVIAKAREQVGYLEKKSNAMLDDKTANTGSGNYTKYARDLDAIPGFYNGKKNGYPWCDVYFDWLFVTCFGAEAAKEMLGQPDRSYGAGCEYSANYYKKMGRFYTEDPQPGDQIFFRDFAHTGLVASVDEAYVYTIEGNTSTQEGVVANGGGVWEKRYPLGAGYIDGYGRPKYDPETEEGTPAAPEAEEGAQVPPGQDADAPEEPDRYTREDFIRDVQAATGAAVDGIAGPETLGKTVTLSRYKNSRHAAVKPVQRWLYALGYTQVGEADGVAGPKFSQAVKAFQADHDCVRDGEITRGNKTWRKLLQEAGT